MKIDEKFTLSYDSGFYISREIETGVTRIHRDLLNVHQELKNLGCNGLKIMITVDKLLNEREVL